MKKHCRNCIHCTRDKDKIYYCANKTSIMFEKTLVIKNKYKIIYCQLFEGGQIGEEGSVRNNR